MPSKFEVSCQSAREFIAVPDVPMNVIRDGAQHLAISTPKRRYGLIAAILASLSIVAVAAATELLGVRISFNPSGPMQVYAIGGKMVPHPARADFQAAVDQVNFPVLLPMGLPAGTEPSGLFRAAKSAIFITYNLPGKWRRSNHILEVVLADPKVVATSNALPPLHMPMEFEMGGTARAGGVLWHIGNEDVIVLKSTITASELAHFKSEMAAAAAAHAGNASAIAAVPTANPADAANVPRGTRVSFERDGTLRLSSDGFAYGDLEPTEANLRKMVSHMAFPVVLPTGLPMGTKATNFSRDARTAIIFYDLPGAWRKKDHLLKIMLIDPRVIVASDKSFDQAKFALRSPGARGATRWNIGHEQVIFLRSTLTTAEMAHVKNAMLAAAASQP